MNKSYKNYLEILRASGTVITPDLEKAVQGSIEDLPLLLNTKCPIALREINKRLTDYSAYSSDIKNWKK